MKLDYFFNSKRKDKVITHSLIILMFGLLFCLPATYLQAQDTPPDVDGGRISTEDPTTICLDDEPDIVRARVRRASGLETRWVVTDRQGIIVDLQRQRRFRSDFNNGDRGVCFIYNLSYNTIRGLRRGRNIDNLRGDFALSNRIRVAKREPRGGQVTGGPFEFVVDGQPDFVSGIELSRDRGRNGNWVITDDQGKILGLPPTIEALQTVNFDDAGPGVCVIYHLSFEDGFLGAIQGNNIRTDLSGCFSLSNPITVTRTSLPVVGGTLSGGPFEFCVDGEPDFVSGIVPPSPDVVDFDGAGAGTCLIYSVSFNGELQGAAPGNNIRADLTGDFELSSNAIAVVRNQPIGGTIEGGPFEFVIDGQPDFATGITLSGNQGTNSQWVITDDQGKILGLPPSPDVVNFDDAGPGVCLIWHLSFEDGLEGAIPGNNAATDLVGCYSLSNPITVTRTEPAPVEPLTGRFSINSTNNQLSVSVMGGDKATRLKVVYFTLFGWFAGIDASVVSSESGNTVTTTLDTSNLKKGPLIAILINPSTGKKLAKTFYINR